MKLTDIHSNLKRENDKCVVIIKYGQFYRVFNHDTYIIWYFTKYKIHNNRLGFPKEVLEKIKKNLDSISTDYIIYENDNFKKYSFYNNQYDIVLKLSKNEYKKEEILNKLKRYDCLDDIERLLKKYE